MLELSGTIVERPPWMEEVLELSGTIVERPPWMEEVLELSGTIAVHYVTRSTVKAIAGI